MLHKISLFLLLLVPLSGFATHLRSGEISYRPVPGPPNTYEITVTIYTFTGLTPDGTLANDEPVVPVINFGDGQKATNVPRTNGPFVLFNNGTFIETLYMGEVITSSTKKNLYTITHTFAQGTFVISVSAPSRNYGILNVPSIPSILENDLYVESMLTIKNTLTPISSPVLSLPPIGDGCTNFIYKINPGAIDPDRDELRYRLVKCKTTNGQDVIGYKYPNEVEPNSRSTFKMDSITGLITWDKPTPTSHGVYNIAFKIEKRRNGILIGYVLRDMQVTIEACDNNPPVIDPLQNYCVEAGTPLTFNITSHDADGDPLVFTTTGMPYDITNIPPATCPDKTGIGSTSSTFNWNINTSHYSKYPYIVYYKVTDTHLNAPSLSDVASNFITVIPPSVKNVHAIASVDQKSFDLTWDPTVVAEAIGYNVYRKKGPSDPIDACMLGVPPTSGYLKIGPTYDRSTLSINDSNNGMGFTSGIAYCYIVTAVLPSGAETALSTPDCATSMLPIINVIQNTISSCQSDTLSINSRFVKFPNTDEFTTFLWSTTTPNELLLTNTNKPVVDVKFITPGTYELKLVATSGVYVDNATFSIRINATPVAKIDTTEAPSTPGKVTFYNKSINFNSSKWSFLNNTISNSNDSFSYQFDNDKNGNYRIYLEVTNESGCSDTTSILCKVAMWGAAMPNAFEPGNTNVLLNTFRPAVKGLQSYYLGIWDLWGNLIWETRTLLNSYTAKGWDGNDSKGNKMPSQNYIWRMSARLLDGSEWLGVKDKSGHFHKEGTFILLR